MVAIPCMFMFNTFLLSFYLLIYNLTLTTAAGYEDLKQAAANIAANEASWKDTLRVHMQDNEILKAQLVEAEITERGKIHDIILLAEEYSKFKDFVATTMVDKSIISSLQEQNKRDNVPIKDFLLLKQKLHNLETDCQFKMVDKDIYNALMRDHHNILEQKRIAERECNDLLSEKINLISDFEIKKGNLESLLEQQNIELTRLNDENAVLQFQLNSEHLKQDSEKQNLELLNKLNEMKLRLRQENIHKEQLIQRLADTEKGLNNMLVCHEKMEESMAGKTKELEVLKKSFDSVRKDIKGLLSAMGLRLPSKIISF